MPHVAELFGHRLLPSRELRTIARKAHCPHADGPCDGGGNRDMARWPAMDLPLAPLFDESVSIESNGFIPCGVCSVRLGRRGHAGSEVNWSICPHRLLTFGSHGFSRAQRTLGVRVMKLAGYAPGDRVKVWSEVTLADKTKNVNYRLDYVLRREGTDEPPTIVEVMTASTSGGNKSRGTDIRSAFCNAVLYANGLVPDVPESPGVNVRQVWARMASQLIVKSEIANSWGGRTIWVVQDALIDYIRRNTGLPLDHFHSTEWIADEVNVVTGNLDDPDEVDLYAGPIRGSQQEPCWMELLSTPGLPAVDALLDKLVPGKLVGTIAV